MVRRQPEDRLKGDMAIKAPVVAEDEFVEVGIEVLAAEAMVGAEAPPLQEREKSMDPFQRHVPRHVADDTGNHAVSGNLVRCIIVPAVTEACFPHRQHTRKYMPCSSAGGCVSLRSQGRQSHSAIADKTGIGRTAPHPGTAAGIREASKNRPSAAIMPGWPRRI